MMGKIYFIRCNEFVKIGWAYDPMKRRNLLQRGSPYILELIGTIDAVQTQEAAVHRHFAADRVRGEWFRMTPELAAFIDGGTLLDIPLKAA